MTHDKHPSPDERKEFLVDGCPRCREYVDDMGVHFDPDRFAKFWAKMIEVEWDGVGGYNSEYDKELGSRFYLVTLGLQKIGTDPRLPLAIHEGRALLGSLPS